MRAVFGLVSLLVVLAIVGLLASKRLTGSALSAAPSSVVASAPDGVSLPLSPATAREQSQRIQEQVRSDLTKALEQGARKELDQ